jgi:hypothetical protein
MASPVDEAAVGQVLPVRQPQPALEEIVVQSQQEAMIPGPGGRLEKCARYCFRWPTMEGEPRPKCRC